MAHDHAHSHHHHSHKKVNNIYLALILNSVFVIIEIIGGFYAGSLAILADAFHDLSDSLTLFIAWILERFSQKGATKKFSYGFKRLSLLSSLFVSGVLIAGSIAILVHSALHFNEAREPNATVMLWLAGLGVLFNGWAYWKLSHGHSHNEKALSLHMLTDVLGWVAVLIVAVTLHFFDWPWLDSILAMGIAFFTLAMALKNFFQSANLFLQAHPDNFDQEKYLSQIRQFAGIRNIHDFHVWSLDGEHHIISYHLEIEKQLSPEAVAELKIRCRSLLKPFGHFHCTIETETVDENCSDRCEPTKA